jgi:uncharacterized repeat protein (TIGR02543 family)
MYDYRDKLRGQDDRRSVYDILSLNGTEKDSNGNIILHQYEAVGIDKVKIDGNTFSNYGAYQFIWEKTFVKSPERSANGSLGNLNSYATFRTPHLILDFSVMSIDDYRAIMRMHYEKNEFIVECYDPIYNDTIKVKMYFGTEQMAKLYTINRMRLNSEQEWEDWIELVGVQEYQVELIGTNNDIELVSVIYHLNPPSELGISDDTIGEPDVYNGEEVLIGRSATQFTDERFGGKYQFDSWNISPNPTDVNKGVYINGNAYTINENGLVLYAQWRATDKYILTLNYGIADAQIDELTNTYITQRQVSYGARIGDLPSVTSPKVKAIDITDGKEKEYSPYHSGNWYKTPIKATNSTAVDKYTTYWLQRDGAIYLIYDVYKYYLTLIIDGSKYQENYIAYNTPMNLPILVKEGYAFDGWYYTSDFKSGTKINNSDNMKPYRVTLYARWVKQ